MTQPLTYRDDLRLRARRPSMIADRVKPEPGDVIIDSAGAYDWTAAGAVPREPRVVQFAVETRGEGHHETFARGEPLWATAFVGLLMIVFVASLAIVWGSFG